MAASVFVSLLTPLDDDDDDDDDDDVDGFPSFSNGFRLGLDWFQNLCFVGLDLRAETLPWARVDRPRYTQHVRYTRVHLGLLWISG